MTWRTVVGTVATFVTTIVLAFWLINEPARMKEAEEGFAGRSISQERRLKNTLAERARKSAVLRTRS